MGEMPRRVRMENWCEAERAIYVAKLQVEKMGADPRLTDAILLLNAAQSSVADHIDGVEKRRFVETK